MKIGIEGDPVISSAVPREDISDMTEKGLEALPMAYVLEVETLLDAYLDFKKEKTPTNQEVFVNAAKRIGGMRKLFASNQEGFRSVQKEIRDALDRHNLGINAVDSEGVLEGMKTFDQKEFSQKIMLNSEPISPYDEKVLAIIGEAGV